MEFDIGFDVFPSGLDDIVDYVMAVNGGRHHADETGGGDIIGAGETMGAHEVAALFKPLVETGVALKLAKGIGGADVDEETDDFVGVVGANRSVLEASDVLGDGVAGGDVTLH